MIARTNTRSPQSRWQQLTISVALALLLTALCVPNVTAVGHHTKSRTIVITITKYSLTESSDQTLTETMSASMSGSRMSPTAERSKSRTRTPTPEISRSDTPSVTPSKSATRDQSVSVSASVMYTNTLTDNVTLSKATMTISRSLTRALSSSESLSEPSPTKDVSATVTLTQVLTLSSTQQASTSVSASSVASSTRTLPRTSSKSLIMTSTRTLIMSDSATRIRHSRTKRRHSHSVTVTIPITFTITSGTPTMILTPTRTWILTDTVTTSDQVSESRSLVDTHTRTWLPTVTKSSSDPKTRTSTLSVRITPTTTLLDTRSPTKTPTTSGTDEHTRTRSSTMSATRSTTADDSETRSTTETSSQRKTHTVTVLPTPTPTPTDGGSKSESQTQTLSGTPTLSGSPSIIATASPTDTATVSLTTTITLQPTLTHNPTPTSTMSPSHTNLVTITSTDSSDLTITATRTLTPPRTITHTLSDHLHIDLGNLAKLGVTLFLDDTPGCMRVVLYIGLFPFAGLLFAVLYSIVCAIMWPKVDVDTFADVKQWRSLLSLHSYLSILFPCHYHCAIHHALIGLIHYNLTTGLVAAMTLSLKPEPDSSIVIALTGIFAAVTPHLIRPVIAEVMYYYSFDERDLRKMVYVDLDEGGEDDEPIPVSRNEGGEDRESAAREEELNKVVATIPDVGDLADSELSSLGDVELPQEDEPIDERAFKALNSFVFHFTDDVGSRGGRSLKSGGLKTISTTQEDPSDDGVVIGVFGDFTPLHTPRQPAETAVEMDEPGMYPYMPISVHGILKGLLFLCILIPCVAMNFKLTQRIEEENSGECGSDLNGFMKSLIVALVLDVIVFQQAYLAILLGLRILRATDDKYSFCALHPYSGEMRPLEGELLRKQMDKEDYEIKRVLDAEQQRRKIEDRLDLDDDIEIIAAPDADVPQTLEPIDDHRDDEPRHDVTFDVEELGNDSSEEGEEEDSDEEEEDEEEPEPVRQAGPQTYPSAFNMMSMLHGSQAGFGSPLKR